MLSTAPMQSKSSVFITIASWAIPFQTSKSPVSFQYLNFDVGSDKGAVIALPYGVEGFATPKHLVKQDGTQAQLEEKLPFKVIEFNKDAKRIILSHSRIFEDEAKAEAKKENAAKKAAKKAAKADDAIVTPQMEKTTLGDIDALAALKEKLDAEKK
jgi:small subunit ribosomal protein S1